jgi:hypothetical protein
MYLSIMSRRLKELFHLVYLEPLGYCVCKATNIVLVYESAKERHPPSNGNLGNYCLYLERLQDLLIYESANQRTPLSNDNLGTTVCTWKGSRIS